MFDEYFEEITEEQNSIFNIKEGDIYYSICDDSDVESIIFENDSYDNKYIQSGNAFLTEKEAEKEVNRRKAIQRIKKYCFENNIQYKENVSDETFYIGIIYDYEDEEFYPSTCTDHIDYGFLFFDSYEDVDKVINNCKSELNIIFDV
ncbi:hypothetical protein BKN14_00340 [Candidatus Gracilibacteria bacterium HOT-871]|nr:hypothetical protein BKN14_00340 [Candidatus Gracilibacteria bacterium HOT-871]